MVETQAMDRHSHKECHKSDRCAEECVDYSMVVDSVYVGLVHRAAGPKHCLLS